MRFLLKLLGPGGLAALVLLAVTAGAFAQESTTIISETIVAAPVPTIDTGDTAWMLTSTALVLLMTIPGVALFYCGMVRKKNVLDVAVQSFAICCLVTVLWFVIGYSLAFISNPNPDIQTYIGGFDNFLLKGMKIDSINSLAPTIPESVYMMFQMTFAIITPALITGAFADRMKFSAVILFLTAWSLLVYTPIAHWVWGGGFLGANAGVLDFAGGTVVHINAGIAGLVACIMVGKRKGYGIDNMAPHNLVLSLTGASLLWVGWFGFNAGSAVASGGRAGMAMAVTQIATATAALTWMFVEWTLRKKPSVLGIVSGAVAGLVAITPASGFVNPMGALVIGIAAGIFCYWGAVWLKPALGYDDSLDVFGVHGIGGIVGAVLTGVFADPGIAGKDPTGVPIAGLLYGNPGQVWTQIQGVLTTIVWCGLMSFVILFVVKLLVGLRVDEETEVSGLDISLHGETVQ
jgi:ammonium transporter, Amt family